MSTSSPHLLVEDSDGVRTIVIDRPERKNALTTATRAELCRLLIEAEKDGDVHALVITGSEEIFSAGVDFTELSDDFDLYRDQFAMNPALVARASAKPIIAAVSGACVSGALEIALSCSFIVASRTARFADTHARLGGIATWGLTALLPRAVGVRRAREMSLTGAFIDAHEAKALGFVNHVVEVEELRSFAQELAASLVRGPVAGDLLSLYARSADPGLPAAFAMEAAHVVRQSFSPEEFAQLGAAHVRRQ